MKIQSIRISNILSFEHHNNIEDCEEILFDDGLNILIGPNGAGKSNFLEIINQIFTRLFFKQCIFTEEQLQRNQEDPAKYPLNQTLQLPNFPPSSIRQNNKTSNVLKKIRLTIKVGDEDIQNLQFIQRNIVPLTEIATKYCKQNNIAPDEYNLCVFSHPFNVTYDIRIDTAGNFTTNSPASKPLQLIIQKYLHWFEFIQKIILIGNSWESHKWEPLKNSFAVISGYRNYDSIGTSYTISDSTKSAKLSQIREKMSKQSLQKSTAEEPLVFQYVKNYLAYEYDRIRNDVADNPQGKNAEEILNDDQIFQGINASLSKTLQLTFKVSKNPSGHDYLFNFEDEKGIIQNSELSAGQKGIIHFIFSLYGYELKNGMLIIDEPELHVHPQIQEKYVEIIKQVEKDLGIQFVIATHSPIFVNPDTINGVLRFYKNENGFTNTKRHTNVTQDVKDKIQMLNYINSSKIFFANKVILVEGDSDNYFYKHYLQNYKSRTNRKTEDIEFLEMDSANRIEKWYDLLEEFKIKFFYIGDFDNLKLDFITQNATTWKNQYSAKLLSQEILQIKSSAPSTYNTMIDEISNNYSRHIFLLSRGSLEDYMEFITGKRGNFDRVINFCNNSFESWMNYDNNKEMKDELDYFFHCISISS